MKKFKLDSKPSFFKQKKFMKKFKLDFKPSFFKTKKFIKKFKLDFKPSFFNLQMEDLTKLPVIIMSQLGPKKINIFHGTNFLRLNLIITTVSNFHLKRERFLILNNISLPDITK